MTSEQATEVAMAFHNLRNKEFALGTVANSIEVALENGSSQRPNDETVLEAAADYMNAITRMESAVNAVVNPE